MKRASILISSGLFVLNQFFWSTTAYSQHIAPAHFISTTITTDPADTKVSPKAAVSSASVTIMEVISTSKRTQLTDLLGRAALFSYLSGKTTYTFFAPADETLPDLEQLDADKLRAVLLQHLVAGRYTAADLKEGTRLLTAAGNYLTILRKKEVILINGVAIVSPDEAAANGIIHTLNGTFPPRSSR